MCSSGCLRRTLLEQIFARSSPRKKCIGTKLGDVHCLNIQQEASTLILNWFNLATIALVYLGIKRVCSSCRGQRTLLEQFFACSSPPRKCIGNKLVGVYHLNIRQGASPLIFNWFTIATITLVYWRSKRVCSSGCVRWTVLEQIYASTSLSRSTLVPFL